MERPYGQVMEFASEIRERVDAGENLILFGPPGTGKDHLMVGCMFEAVWAGDFTVKWLNGLDWFGANRDAIDRETSEAEIVRNLAHCDVLAMSDPLPPDGDLSGYQGQMLMRVIDRRYRNLKSTWLTINVADGQEAEKRLGCALVDRLRHGSLAIHCSWESYRKARPS